MNFIRVDDASTYARINLDNVKLYIAYYKKEKDNDRPFRLKFYFVDDSNTMFSYETEDELCKVIDKVDIAVGVSKPKKVEPTEPAKGEVNIPEIEIPDVQV